MFDSVHIVIISGILNRCGLRKTEKIFSASKFDSFLIRTSNGRALASELVLLRGGLPSEIALQGGSLESKIVYRGVGADFGKPKIYFWLSMTG